MVKQWFYRQQWHWVDSIILLLIYLFLLALVPMEPLFSQSTITGGDTASHFQTAAYLHDVLLPQGKIIAWESGGYGGYPLFLMYFPLLYLVAAGLSDWLTLPVAMKLVTLAGPMLLPLTLYWLGRLSRLPSPAPSLMALGSLLFLLNQANTMWGGNLLSTLAGEFSYAFSFALTFAFLGGMLRLDHELEQQHGLSRWLLVVQVLLLWAIGLSHGFTLIFCVLSCVWFLASRQQFLQRFGCVLVIFGCAGLLFSWWFVQLFFGLPYTTAFNLTWHFSGVTEIVPPLLWPSAAIFVCATFWLWWRRHSLHTDLLLLQRFYRFVWAHIALIAIAFFSSDTLHLPDIRFIPFAQLLVAVTGLATVALLLRRLPSAGTLTLVATLLVFAGLSSAPSPAARWLETNFKGFEGAPQWPLFQQLNQAVAGTRQEPRVAYEHNMKNQAFGSVRAFESLPHFSGRATLEGLYFQSSLLSPFVFYTQSLYSEQASCPFPDYPCSQLDLVRAYPYLQLLNVNQLIVVSDAVRQQLQKLPGLYQQQKTISNSPYEIWQLQQPQTHYVQALTAAPTYVEPTDFRFRFYQWFRQYDGSQALLYTKPTAFNAVYGNAELAAPATQSSEVKATDCDIQETQSLDQISFSTNCVGQAHLLKISYHPGWKVSGAVGPYLASPAFMLVWPTQSNVVLQFDNQGPRRIGGWLNIIGLVGFVLLLLWAARWPVSLWRWQVSNQANAVSYRVYNFILLLIGAALLLSQTTPSLSAALEQAQQKYNLAVAAETTPTERQTLLRELQQEFDKLATQAGHAPLLDRIQFHRAMSYFLLGDYATALPLFQQVSATNDSIYRAQAYYHLGLSAMATTQWPLAKDSFLYIINELRDPYWSPHAQIRLTELPDHLHPAPDHPQND